MSDFIRRMTSGTVFFRRPDDEGGASLTPTEGDQLEAGGTPSEPAAGTPAAESGTAADGSASGTTPSEGAAAEVPPAPAAPDRAQQRMNQLVAERWTERRAREAAEQQARLLQEQLNQTRAALQTQPQVGEDGQPVQQQQQPVRQVPQPDLQQMAAQIAANNAFNERVAAEVARGRAGHQDFDQVAANLQRFGELPRTFVQAAMATGKGAEVMYHLGGDIAEADRILSLEPIEQAVALAALAGSIKAPEPAKKVTSAPPPVTPKVGSGAGRNTPSLEDNNLPIADWIKLREKSLPKRAGR